MSKLKQVQGSLYSFFGGKQSSSSDDKEINTALETPALTKKHAGFRGHGRINTNGWGLMERKTNCSASFVEISRIGKTCNTP